MSQICWVFFFFFVFGVSLLRFSYLLSLFLGLQNFWDLLDFLYRLVC